MKSRSSFAATILIPLLLVSCLVSVFSARSQQARVHAAEAEAEASRQAFEALDALALRVRSVAAGRSNDPHAGKTLELALAETVSAAMERRVNDAISIETLSAMTGGGSTRTSSLSDMARAVPYSGGQLRAVSVRLKGSYGHFQGLRDYLASFSSLPVAVTAFSASERSFEVVLTVFGS
jgi:hypothetical protein